MARNYGKIVNFKLEEQLNQIICYWKIEKNQSFGS